MTPRSPLTSRLLTGSLQLFFALLLLQVYLAGAFLMGGVDVGPLHEALGYSLGYILPLPLAALALIARAGWWFWRPFALIIGLLLLQPVITYVPTDISGLGWLRALHPLNGVLLILLVRRLANRSARDGDDRIGQPLQPSR